jgi:amidase/6-aminohexanoate-cyclic-dimer hydrolase
VKNYESYDALGLAELIRQGEVKPSEVLEAAIARCEERNPKLNAVVVPMIDEARQAAAGDLPNGPFRGVPFLLKDLYLLTTGARTTNGCRLFEDFVADYDSEIVVRYRKAGLVIFGKTTSPEFGLTTTTESKVFGQTRNPWNTDHTTGGSSGGAAAAVAAGIVPLANASDGGGSIRIPASCCGLFGMKPTRARTPAGPDAGEGWSGMSAVHAVSRSVRDNAALLDATAGPDLGAPYWAAPPERPFLEEVGRPPGRLRIAFQSRAFNEVETHPDCIAAVEGVSRLCAELGHEVEETPFSIDHEAFRQATGTIIGANLRATVQDRAAVLGREFGPDDLEPGTYAMATAAAATGAEEYARSIRVIHAIGRQVAGFMERYDAILTPTMPTPPLPLGALSLSHPDLGEFLVNLLKTIGFTQLFNATGNPAMSVPLVWNDAGLPIGVQFAGRFGDEATLFRLAGQLEQARPWFDRRPPV